MIITTEEAKTYLRVDYTEDDTLIAMEIEAAEEYIKNATDKTFDSTNKLARLFCLMLVQNMYDQRAFSVSANEETSLLAKGFIFQLKYCYTATAE